jgi:hypothetical protein
MKVTVGGDTGRALAEVYESLGEYGSESRSADLMPHIMEIVYIAARGNMKISTVTGSPLGQMLEAMQVYLAPALAKVLD